MDHLEIALNFWNALSMSTPVALLLSVGAAAGAISGYPRLVSAVKQWTDGRNARAVAEAMANIKGVASFTSEDILRSLEMYVEPNCSSTDPADEDDLRNVVALAPLFKTIDAHLASGGEKRHIILLADSGMGKTSFCINYYSRELKKPSKARRPVVIVPLGRPSAIEQIKGVENKSQTLLFLDAFDEDPLAIEDRSARLTTLMSTASDFRNIVVTCRSQFFSDDDSIPKGSGIMYAAPRRAGQGREFPLHKLFLAPLSSAQINSYLKRNFPYTSYPNWKRRKQAHELVATIPELSVRPMLLELIPDLIREKKAITQLFGLYEYLVEKWLQRENYWISESDLLEISLQLAVSIFLQQRKGLGDRIQAIELEAIAKNHKHPLEGWKLKSRSLLNRDIQGEYKFAHRSILEYLFLVAAIRGDERCFTVEWTDLMKDLLASWGNIPSPAVEALSPKLFSRASSATKLQPFAAPLAPPKLLSERELKNILGTESISVRHSRQVPLAWRNAGLSVEQIGAPGIPQAYKVIDSTHGVSWALVDTSGISETEEILIYRDRYSRPHKITPDELNGVDTFLKRLPSTHEMISLWESEPHICAQLKIKNLLNPKEIYWLGDSTDDGPLCCSFGLEPTPVPGRRLIVGARFSSDGRYFHLYVFKGRNGIIQGEAHKALAAYIYEPVA